jgi:hypothetical protein
MEPAMKAGSFALLTALLLAATGAISAQQQSVAPPTPLPHAPAALRVPQPLAGLQPGLKDLYQDPNRPDQFQQLRPSADLFPTSPFVFVPGFVYGLSSTMNMASTGASPQTVIARGGLRFETQPELAQVYVDGFYVGIVEDYGLSGRALDLTVGAHRIELRAAGYETLAFDVTIAPNGVVRYRGDLRALGSPAAAKVAPSSKTIYVIPQCYAGDTPPLGVLPARCRLADMRVRLLP